MHAVGREAAALRSTEQVAALRLCGMVVSASPVQWMESWEERDEGRTRTALPSTTTRQRAGCGIGGTLDSADMALERSSASLAGVWREGERGKEAGGLSERGDAERGKKINRPLSREQPHSDDAQAATPRRRPSCAHCATAATAPARAQSRPRRPTRPRPARCRPSASTPQTGPTASSPTSP